jgi:hypothetical protein
MTRELIYYGGDRQMRPYDDRAAMLAYVRIQSRGKHLPPGVEQALLDERAAAAIPAGDQYRLNFSLPPCVQRELRRLQAEHAGDEDTLMAIEMMQIRDNPYALTRYLDAVARARLFDEVQMNMLRREAALHGLTWNGEEWVEPDPLPRGLPNRYRR